MLGTGISWTARAAELGFLPHLGTQEFATLAQHLTHLFKEGSVIRNVMRKTLKDNEIFLYDYKWSMIIGKGISIPMTDHGIAFHSSKLTLPYFELRPKKLLDRIGEVIGYKGISLPPHEAFSRRYYLRAADENEVRLLFQRPDLLHLFETSRHWYVGGAREWLVVANPKSNWVKPRVLEKFVQEATTIFERMNQ